ncbi:MAG: HAD family hydrolase [Pseudomonadota bacterium]|nr:HAD family hydrolase [Pseudomonadota bacterium]
MNIAMWSGPRNLSTAMMYSFGARDDCAVWDEPFYAAYLSLTGIDHPMADETLAAGERDPAKVAEACKQAHPSGKAQFYQKHMTHHMVDGVPLDWVDAVSNVFLIRHPARVLASYAKKRENPTLDDIGFRQQVDLFERMKTEGLPVVVVDSFDIRQSPEAMLTKLCERIGIAFDTAMLSWPAGGHPDDGAWGPHWYGAVHRSTGFAGPEGALPEVDETLRDVFDAAMPYYETMLAEAISV